MTPRLLQRFDTRPSARRALGLMHPECPIEQALRGADDRAQRALQQEIWNAPSFVETDALLVADWAKLSSEKETIRKENARRKKKGEPAEPVPLARSAMSRRATSSSCSALTSIGE